MRTVGLEDFELSRRRTGPSGQPPSPLLAKNFRPESPCKVFSMGSQSRTMWVRFPMAVRRFPGGAAENRGMNSA